MLRRFNSVLITSLLLLVSPGFAESSKTSEKPSARSALPPAPNARGEYGDVKFKALDAKPITATFSEEEVIIKTTVTEVCLKKGCWMKVKNIEPADPIRVTFKDYGFFVPTELVGKEVALSGRYVKHTETVAEQKHLLKDAKRPKSEIDAIKEPKETIRFVASGVKDLSNE